MGGNYNPLSATIIRMLTANVAMWVIAIATRRILSVARGAANDRALLQTAAGAVFGPFLGVWLSLVALNHTKAGIASTLISLVPVFIIPAVMIVYRKRPSPRAVLGAIVAVAGVAIIFLAKQP
jgi:drug/metabolite transporter (DMT)-like permease